MGATVSSVLSPAVARELEAIRTAVYSGDRDRNPEDDVRFLLGLVGELAVVSA